MRIDVASTKTRNHPTFDATVLNIQGECTTYELARVVSAWKGAVAAPFFNVFIHTPLGFVESNDSFDGLKYHTVRFHLDVADFTRCNPFRSASLFVYPE